MKLISLNVEKDRHWELITPFLERERPDVLCLQEVFKEDAARVSERFGMEHFFGPMTLETMPTKDSSNQPIGVAIFSRTPLANPQITNYYSPGTELKVFDTENKRATMRQVLLSADAEYEGKIFTVAGTHFTWPPDGLPNDAQRVDAEALLKLLSGLPEVILCGDFNIPRGVNDLYEKFTARYEDAIPKSYASSLDMTFHRVRNDPAEVARLIKFMVDYVFLSKKYRAENVRLQSGLSDHCAVIGDIFAKA